MNKQEILNEMKKLENQLERLELEELESVENELFLLSVDEYERYKNVIPKWNSWWWLRSPSSYKGHIVFVHSDGSLYEYGYDVRNDCITVRPAIILKENKSIEVGQRVIYKDFPFICIDKERKLFIAEIPIACRRFDEKTNDYLKSEIRQFLKDWLKNRVDK